MANLEAFPPSYTQKHVLENQLLKNGLSKTVQDPLRKRPTTMRLLPGPTSSHAESSLALKQQRKVESVFDTINKLAKGKLSFGAKVLQIGGAEKVFRKLFCVREEEELIKASKCCLYTTAGPVAGRFFISTDKLAFCSDKPIAKLTSASQQSLRFHYKVVIPLTKIKGAGQSESVKKPSQKYLQVVTTDDFEFWFMGFVNFKRIFKCIQLAVSQNLQLVC